MQRKRRNKNKDDDNGFAEWGGYMEAKKTKLRDQFKCDAANETTQDGSHIFDGVAIFVNGYSVPSADELKLLMMKHGGVYHHYKCHKTTHIIATNLPDTKVKHLRNMNIVKPDWIVESINAGQLLDYRHYLLYSRQSKTQPKLIFKPLPNEENIPSTSKPSLNCMEDDLEDTTDSDEDQININNKVSGTTVSTSRDGKVSSRPTETKNMVNAKPISVNRSNQPIKTAREDGFLSEFYSNSRLHHISTMGATFKQYVNTLREKSTGLFPGVDNLKLSTGDDHPNFLSVSNTNVIMHIDMDCFFVSVGLRDRPELKGHPVAVTHAKAGSSANHRLGVNRKVEFDLYKTRRNNKYKIQQEPTKEREGPKQLPHWSEAENDSMSEIASCNYEARKFGLKNGMFLGQALKLCPNLKTIPYDFDGYTEVSYCLYDTVASYTLNIEAVSCDEMFVDCMSLLNASGSTPLQLASVLRAEIKEKTGCPCSTGFGANRLQARLATRRAKPDGQFYLEQSAVTSFMASVPVADLPGVGRSTSYRLNSMGISTCQDLQQLALTKLQSEFGMKNGESLYKHCRGEDTKKLVFGQVRKSVSAEVNYGIRFQNFAESEKFIRELAKEVHSRLTEINMRTKFITLKLMVKAKDAPAETAKFLGHGVCDHVTKSVSLQQPVADLDTIAREVLSISKQLNVEPKDLRGIGIQLSRLDTHASKMSITARNAIDKFLCPKSEVKIDPHNVNGESTSREKQSEAGEGPSTSKIVHFFPAKKHIGEEKKKGSKVVPPKPTDIDINVLEALPDDIRREVMLEYGLKPEQFSEHSPNKNNQIQTKINDSCGQYNEFGINFSQIDLEVLEELPMEIKEEIKSSARPKSNKESALIQTPEEIKGPHLAGDVGPSEVRALVKAWTASEERPHECDVLMLADYLGSLVGRRQLDALDICVSCLHRCIEKRQCKLWQDAYFSIINSVQQKMVAVYGLPLCIPKRFKLLA